MSLITILSSILNAIAFIFFFIGTLDYDYNLYIPENNEQVDFIVVGAGTAGAIVAGRLSEISENDVLLIEAGERPKPSYYIAFTIAASISNDIYNYITASQRESIAGGLTNRAQHYPRGKAIGGSGIRNGCKMLRGSKEDFNNWESLGNTGWSYNDVLPYFKKFETYDGPMTEETEQYRGLSGPISVVSNKEPNEIQAVLFEAADEMGYDTIDYNAGSQNGIGYFQARFKDGERHTSADAYIRPYIKGSNKRENLKLLSNAVVTKILFNDTSAIGVQYERKGKTLTVRARKEIIISGGAIESPKLLMLSGIGPQAELDKHQIPVRLDVPGVGENFQDHISVASFLTWYQGSVKSFSTFSLLNPFNILKYMFFRSGVLAETNGNEAEFLFNLSGDDPEWPDSHIEVVSLHPRDIGDLYYTGIGFESSFVSDYFKSLSWGKHFTMTAQVTRPYSKGTVTLNGEDSIYGLPVIDPNIMDDIRDVYQLANITKFAVTYGNASAFTSRGVKFYDEIVPGCSDVAQYSDEYYQCMAKKMVTLAFHACCTCKMSPNTDDMAVVSPELKVYGFDNLRVIDASIMPVIITTNTDATTYMIGEKGADMIKNDWGMTAN